MPRVDWRGRALRTARITLPEALAVADRHRAVRIARGGKADDRRYDIHRALERLARAVRATRREGR